MSTPDTNDPPVKWAHARKIRAELAFDAHQALINAERHNPELARNPFWRAHRAATFCTFLAEFEAA